MQDVGQFGGQIVILSRWLERLETNSNWVLQARCTRCQKVPKVNGSSLPRRVRSTQPFAVDP
jgi:hypothetical protein